LLHLSLNPYGLAFAVGLQGRGTARANPQAIGLDGFIALVRELGLSTIELDWRWMTALGPDDLARVRESLGGLRVIYSHWLAQEPGERLIDPIERATAVGAMILRLHLTPVLEGARARWGPRWGEMVDHARRTLALDAPRAADDGLVLAIENHQDFGSEELVAMTEALGEHVGIVLDTGNPFAVGEDPVAFVRRAAHRIYHVHLKDYIAQFTNEGYRLVRCAIGDGCVPFDEIAGALEPHRPALAASIEPGALESRHIRVFTPEWWHGYPPRAAAELVTMLGRLRAKRLPDDADCRTPWERMASPDEIVAYEMGQIHRSVEHVRGRRWIQG
jgi:3-oxoisoapionate decarboxylase